MNNHKLETWIGSSIQDSISKAKEVAKLSNLTVEFDFNGIKCIVSPDTNTDWLIRDYFTAFKLRWETIGPDPVENYSPEIQEAIRQRDEEIEKRETAQRLEMEKRDAQERAAFDEKTKGVEIEFLDKEGYDDWKGKNTDPYSACIFEYAESWAKLMQYEMKQGRSLVDCASETSFQLGYLGITGFMYGAAVQILAKHWGYGEVLRKWHNGEYKHTGDGVVNPALLSIA
jgi:gas vesicle protein